MMRLAAKKTKYKDADGLRQAVISDLLEKPSPSSAVAFIKMKWENCGRLF
jgi:hypothetical protein